MKKIEILTGHIYIYIYIYIYREREREREHILLNEGPVKDMHSQFSVLKYLNYYFIVLCHFRSHFFFYFVLFSIYL